MEEKPSLVAVFILCSQGDKLFVKISYLLFKSLLLKLFVSLFGFLKILQQLRCIFEMSIQFPMICTGIHS